MYTAVVAIAVAALLLSGLFSVDRLLAGRGSISAKQAWDKVGTGALLLDVRSENEYAHGHLDGARNIPVGALEARLSELDSGGTGDIVVYCASGHRAALALRILRRHGFSRAFTAGAMHRLSRAKPHR